MRQPNSSVASNRKLSHSLHSLFFLWWACLLRTVTVLSKLAFTGLAMEELVSKTNSQFLSRICLRVLIS